MMGASEMRLLACWLNAGETIQVIRRIKQGVLGVELDADEAA